MRLIASAVITGSSGPAGRHRRPPPGTPIVPAAAAALCLPFMNAPSLTGYPATPATRTKPPCSLAFRRHTARASSARLFSPTSSPVPQVLIHLDGELRVFPEASGALLLELPRSRCRRCGRPAACVGVCPA